MRRLFFTACSTRFKKLYKGEKMSDKFITRDEALKELGISARSLYDKVKQGAITANKINSRVIYYSLKSIRAYKSGKTAQTI
jgi:hypothetical protein